MTTPAELKNVFFARLDIISKGTPTIKAAFANVRVLTLVTIP